MLGGNIFPRPRRFFQRKPSGPRVNDEIRVPQVRLIGSDGKQLGLFATDGAIKLAREEGLDLVELDPNAKPPVCKIVDYGKYKYMLQKKQHESKKHQIVVHIKEIKIRPNIDEHDIEFKLRHVKRFLGDKDKVKVTVQFRGREIQHVERGMDVLKRFIKETEDVGQIDTPPKLEGKSMSMILSPLK